PEALPQRRRLAAWGHRRRVPNEDPSLRDGGLLLPPAQRRPQVQRGRVRHDGRRAHHRPRPERLMAKMTWRGEEWRRRVAKQAALGMERGMALAVDVAVQKVSKGNPPPHDKPSKPGDPPKVRTGT